MRAKFFELKKKGIISLVNAREVILTSKKGATLLATRKKQLASGKECRSSPIRSEATPGDPSARLPKRVKLHGSRYNSSANLFQLESGAKGEVNSTSKAMFIPTDHESSSKYFKSEPFHFRFTKTLKGVLLTL